MLLIAIPFFVILLFSVFGADLMQGRRKKAGKTQRPPSGIDAKGKPILSDPDGRPSKR
jgi:hypothetical protein